MAPLLRFAPSPTGPLHLGGLRTALINHLFAKKHGGKWILRVEDTDATRTTPGSLESIRSGLAWARLEYDYGPSKPGPHGPYFQSERLDLYQTYTKKLIEGGHAYRCFCSPTRLAETRERLARTGSNSTYDKACLSLTEEESIRRVKAGERHIVRLDTSNLPIRTAAEDLVFGQLSDAHGSIATDPILLKSDKRPTYHLANVVDDHEMGITHVIRGEEWLASLPLHLDLYAILEIKPPQFAHLPLLLNPDGSKMSKRNGDVRVDGYIQEGWEPDAVLNWLVLPGWGASHKNQHISEIDQPAVEMKTCSHKRVPDSTTVFTREAMQERFNLTAITHRAVVLDPFKLEGCNKAHLAMHPRSKLAARARQLVEKAYPKSVLLELPYLERILPEVLPRLRTLNDLPAQAPYFFIDPPLPSRDLMSQYSVEHVLRIIRSTLVALDALPLDDWARDIISSTLKKLHTRDDLGGKFMSTIRIAISGMKNGPPIPDIMAIMGKDRTLQILARVKSSLENA